MVEKDPEVVWNQREECVVQLVMSATERDMMTCVSSIKVPPALPISGTVNTSQNILEGLGK